MNPISNIPHPTVSSGATATDQASPSSLFAAVLTAVSADADQGPADSSEMPLAEEVCESLALLGDVAGVVETDTAAALPETSTPRKPFSVPLEFAASVFPILSVAPSAAATNLSSQVAVPEELSVSLPASSTSVLAPLPQQASPAAALDLLPTPEAPTSQPLEATLGAEPSAESLDLSASLPVNTTATPDTSDAVQIAATPQVAPRILPSPAPLLIEDLPAEILSSLTKTIEHKAPTRISLSLNPDNLGQVQLEVAVRHGRVEIAAAASTEAGRQAIEQMIPEIRAMASAAGVSVGDFQMGAGAQSAHDGTRQEGSDETPSKPAHSSSTTPRVTSTPSAPAHNGTVDITT